MPQSRTAIKRETFARAFRAQGLNAKKPLPNRSVINLTATTTHHGDT
jgi:hypothetical protein